MSPASQVLAILMLSDYIPGSKTSVLEEAFNRNLLGAFLLVRNIPCRSIHSLYKPCTSSSNSQSVSF